MLVHPREHALVRFRLRGGSVIGGRRGIGGVTILPGTGRGTMRSMVEGHGRVLATIELGITRGCPSTILRMVPLPPWGRNVFRRLRLALGLLKLFGRALGLLALRELARLPLDLLGRDNDDADRLGSIDGLRRDTAARILVKGECVGHPTAWNIKRTCRKGFFRGVLDRH
jgi:hypothetical protein